MGGRSKVYTSSGSDRRPTHFSHNREIEKKNWFLS
jgi:hypothetical protein